MRRLVAVVAVLAVVVAGAAGLYGLWQFQAVEGPASDVTVVIPKGSGVRGTAAALEKAGVIRNGDLFLIASKITGADRKLRAGEYRVPAGSTMRDVLALLRSGRTVVRRFTVAEGLSVRQVDALIRAEPALDGDPGPLPPEGSLLPETYHFSLGDSRKAIIDRMRAAMDRHLDRLWEGRAPDLPLQTPQEALILASIVEKETGVPSERGRVAGVFVNRLRAGMPLQSDPTIVYGIKAGEKLGRPIRLSELQGATPYNTYTFVGLPPTPIANPGLESLKAVMNPMETDDLYFVADGSGGHAFASSYAEHQRNVQRWRALERQGAR
ncbi:MAG: endolytic transglycosylase MltG [Sphingomonadales bacterium]